MIRPTPTSSVPTSSTPSSSVLPPSTAADAERLAVPPATPDSTFPSPDRPDSSGPHAASGTTPKGSALRSLLFNVVIPIAILCVGASVVAALGSIAPKVRLADDQSPAGRFRPLAGGGSR